MRMKLSEAIRLGSMASPQGHGAYKDYHGRTCAMGAAYDAAGGIDVWLRNLVVPQRASLRCPELSCPYFKRNNLSPEFGVVEQVIIHLNDHHRWTRERIADFVERLEREDVPIASLEPLVEVLV